MSHTAKILLFSSFQVSAPILIELPETPALGIILWGGGFENSEKRKQEKSK